MPALRLVPSLLAITIFASACPAELSAQVAAADAQAFLGAWEATMQAVQGGSFEFDIFLRDQNGQLAGEVTNPQGDTNAIQEFVRAGEELILRYSVNFGGQRSDVQVNLSPNANGMQVILEMGGGQFTADGVAERIDEQP